MTNKQIIKDFAKNENKFSHTANLRNECGEKLMNYATALAQRINGFIVVNSTRYGVSTSKIQGMLRAELYGNFVELDNVPCGTWDLTPFYKKHLKK